MRRIVPVGLLVALAFAGCGRVGSGAGSSSPSQASWKTAVELGMSCESLTGDEHEKCEGAYEAEKNREADEKEANEIKEALREQKRLEP